MTPRKLPTPEELEKIERINSELEPLSATVRFERLQQLRAEGVSSRVLDCVREELSIHPVPSDFDPLECLIDGRYRIEKNELISYGGMGEVYRAIDTKDGMGNRRVALKTIRATTLDDARRKDWIACLEKEIQCLIELGHRHGVVNIFDVGQFEHPVSKALCPYYVMREIRGDSLYRYAQKNHFTVSKRLELFTKVCVAVEHLHRETIAHADLKPSNILVDENGQVSLIDFGIARFITPGDKWDSWGGTPDYMAPEAFDPKYGEVSVKTDVYALGVILYELLTLTSPYQLLQGQDVDANELSKAITDVEPCRLGQEHSIYRDSTLETIALEALEKHAAERCELSVLRTAAEGFIPERDYDPNESPEHLPSNPYRGLSSFGEEDADLFFGRESLIVELSERVQNNSFVPIVGASGSGKSSLIFAGLVPKLKREGHWLIARMRPKDGLLSAIRSSLAALRSASKPVDNELTKNWAAELDEGGLDLISIVNELIGQDPGSRVLLILDQFEEFYTLGFNEAQQKQFLASLHEAIDETGNQPLFTLLITLRADFFDNALKTPYLNELLSRHSDRMVFRPMNTDELRAVIEAPAKQLGVPFEDGLVQRILDDIDRSPTSLPLLEFALTELW